MVRDYGAEIDALKSDLAEMKKILQGTADSGGQPKHSGNGGPRIKKATNLHSDEHVMAVLNRLESTCENSSQSGAISYFGVFESGGRQSTWIRDGVNTDMLLSLIESKMAEKVLACIGNGDRLNILLNILKKPMSVAQLVEECGYNSTGQVYHHLKPLIAADLIVEDEKSEGRGMYVVQPHRVQGIIMLLAGISDMLDTKYTQGEWNIPE